MLDDLFDLATHPAIQPLIQRAVAGNPRETLEARLKATETRLDEIQKSSYSRNPRGGRNGQAETPLQVGSIRDQVVGISGRLDEALRFAREGGVNHPEAKERIDDAKMLILELERNSLMPGQTRTAQDRQVADALSGRVRKLRQKVLNRMWSAEDIADASALAADLCAALQTIVMTQGTRPSNQTGSIITDMRAMEDDDGYGRGGLSKGCIPCALGHLGMAAGSMGQAVKADDDERAQRVVGVQKELDMLLAYDWIPAKIAKNTSEEQRVIADYKPQIERLRDQVSACKNKGDVIEAANAATQLWTNFQRDVENLPTPQMAFARPSYGQCTVEIIREADARIDNQYKSFGFVAPSRADLKAESERTDYHTLMSRIVDRTKDLYGVQWLTQPLGGEDAIYIPATNTIIRTAEATNPENYHLQTTIHESVHALLDNPKCFPAGLSSSKAREIGETEADLTTIATMSALGLPLEYGDGTRESAGDYTIDWDAVEKHFGPEMRNRVEWASRWLTEAAQNGTPGGSCPMPAPIPPSPIIAPGVTRSVGTGLQIVGRSGGMGHDTFSHDHDTNVAKYHLSEATGFARGTPKKQKTLEQRLTEYQAKFAGLASRNSNNVERMMTQFENEGVDTTPVMDAIENYRSIERSDYEDPEDYSSAREEAWGEVTDAIESLEVDPDDESFPDADE